MAACLKCHSRITGRRCYHQHDQHHQGQHMKDHRSHHHRHSSNTHCSGRSVSQVHRSSNNRNSGRSSGGGNGRSSGVGSSRAVRVYHGVARGTGRQYCILATSLLASNISGEAGSVPSDRGHHPHQRRLSGDRRGRRPPWWSETTLPAQLPAMQPMHSQRRHPCPFPACLLRSHHACHPRCRLGAHSTRPCRAKAGTTSDKTTTAA